MTDASTPPEPSSATSPEPDRGPAPIADLVRSERERLGWSLRELARRAELPVTSIRTLEQGRDPRRSTLLKLLGALPGLTAEDFLGGLDRPPSPCPAAADAIADVSGLRLGHLRAQWSAGTFEGSVEQLVVADAGDAQLLDDDPDVPEKRRLGLAHLAALSFTRAAHPFATRFAERTESHLVLAVERHEHEIALGEAVGVVRSYRFLAPDEADDESLIRPMPLSDDVAERGLVVLAPATTVELVVDLEERPRHAWAEARAATVARAGDLPPLPSDVLDVTFSLEPTDDGWRMTGCFRDVPPGLVCRIRWSNERAAPSAIQPSPREEAAEAARGAREASSLTLRDLAKRCGVSHATLLNVESGRDARASTLRAIVDALPEVRPFDLLPVVSPRGDVALERAAAWQARVFGARAASSDSVWEVGPEANRTTATLDGVVSLRHDATTLGLIHGVGPVVFHRSSEDLRSIEAKLGEIEVDGVRTRVLEKREGGEVRQVTIPADLATGGVRFVRTIERPPHRPPAGPEPYWRGCVLTGLVPAGRSRLEVVFRNETRVENLKAYCWPQLQPPNYGLPSRLAALGERVRTTKTERGLVVEVDHLPYGLKLGIGWLMREEPDPGAGRGRASHDAPAGRGRPAGRTVTPPANRR